MTTDSALSAGREAASLLPPPAPHICTALWGHVPSKAMINYLPLCCGSISVGLIVYFSLHGEGRRKRNNVY